MLFSSMVFIFLFLPVTFLLYFSVKSLKIKNTILAIVSVFFYAWGEPKYVILMIISILHNFIFAIFIDKYQETGKQHIAKLLVILSCILNLGFLGYYKYIDFLIENINFVFGSSIPVTNIPLPIGISFYTFQIMSYTIDVYRKNVKVQKNLIYLTAYLAFFPQLIAGPIVNYSTIEKELNERTHNIDEITNGFRRFIIGLGKKLIIANNMASIIDHYIDYGVGNLTLQMAWVGIIAYAFQIYFDFSAYSDMAIGMGRMFGFHFLENFNYPYISKSVTEFWRRWHISLGTWFRDYLYIPLGGNRVGKLRWFINIAIVWFLTGLWHGASWNFILWGLWYGFFLIIEKLFLLNFYKKLPGIFCWIITFTITLFGWVFFRLENPNDIMAYFKALFHLNGAEIFMTTTTQMGEIFPYFMFIFAIIGITPVFKKFYEKLAGSMKTIVPVDLYLIVILAVSISFLLRNTYNPFIYFRF